ncbi:hypothetical protein VPHK71_0012 [Vibrio phage K71]|nr:hypothetical protein SIPHO078v2_p0010 [Vibrio phage 14E30.1]
MKNSDAPAMPIILDYNTNEYNRTVVNDCYDGLTKREMFAMNAPQCPACFEREWSQNNYDNKDYFNTHVDEFAEHCPTAYSDILPKGEMALIKAW